MSRINFRRGTAVLVLGLVLGTPLMSWAAPRAAGWRTGIPEASPAPLARLWTFLAGAWAKNGCRVDPDGRCLDGLQAPAKNGCRVDPFGRCAPGQ
jgi:hypothetical protein